MEQREIRFRAWGGYNMTEPFTLLDLHGFDDGSVGIHEMTANGGEELNGQLRFMQFTGLKDKNGKDIYEGDIVRAVYEEDEGGGWHSDQRVRGAVYFDTHWGVKFDCHNGTQRTAAMWKAIPHTDFRNVEIIGNIYENAELLTK